jgi:formylglycine-generating enzyme required for sulfatase activity
MCGSGQATGIGLTTTGSSFPARSRATRKVRIHHLDPTEPNQKEKVLRGGSFLCTDQYCSRYVVGMRGKEEVSAATNHLGFRCVKNAVHVGPVLDQAH